MGPVKLAGLEEQDDGKSFDQFKGKKSTYDEALYTTKIDDSKISNELKRLAEQKEREILASSSDGNSHLAEERG